jgi:hypothetical protein
MANSRRFETKAAPIETQRVISTKEKIMIEESTASQHENDHFGRIFIAHKRSLVACAAAIAITAAIGTTSVFAGDRLAETSALARPVVNLSAADQGQQPLPSFANLVERVKPAVVSVFVKSDQTDEVSDTTGQQGPNPF